MNQYTKTTAKITVTVQPEYLEDRSAPQDDQYLWAYHVSIENTRDQKVQLRARYWHITDALGQVQEVRGPGVVGEEPVLEPGETFEYTSGVPLGTPSGIMAGAYTMEDHVGDMFDIEIPAFSLDSPHQAIRLN
ncbi:MAG: Co2+/Mg2+ efflux protein ApaG [Pseudomonadota bacterium]